MPRLIGSLVAASLFFSLAAPASGDPISVDGYRQALVEARTAILRARDLRGAERDRAIARVGAALEGLREVRARDATYTDPPHRAIVELLRAGEDASLARAAEMVDELVAAIDRASRPAATDPAEARRELDGVLTRADLRPQSDWREALLLLFREVLARLFPGLRAPVVDVRLVAIVAASISIVLAAIVLSVTGRGLRERIRREVALASVARDESDRARRHLLAADEAAFAGRLREAVRELFLFALLALDERGAIRHDPALTDREVLQRASGLPEARALADLVDVYERSWYGLREPAPAEVERARELAQRVAA